MMDLPRLRFTSPYTRIATLILVALTLSSSPSPASRHSDLLTTHGMSEFKAERYGDALALFDEAVAADGEDIYAHYYRGVTLGRLGKYEGAIEDLTFVLRRDAGFDQAALELGIVLWSDGQYVRSKQWLRQAKAVQDLRADASFFLGMSHFRLNELDEAEKNLIEASSDERLTPMARFYLGLVHYHRREWKEAAIEFDKVRELAPASDVGAQSVLYLELIENVQSKYRFYGELGLSYDSNVVLAPSDDNAVNISDEGDGLVSITAGGAYWPWRTNGSELSIGYEFFQTLHFDLSEFDLQNHRPNLQYVARIDAFEVGFQARYDYYLLDGDSLLQQPGLLSWTRYATPDFGYSELLYWFRWRDYQDDAFSDELDAIRHSVGVRQYIYLDTAQQKAWLGYRFDRNGAVHAEGRKFAFDRHQIGVGIDWLVRSWGVALELAYWFHHDDFDSPSAGRNDDRHTLALNARKKLGKNVAIKGGYTGIFNESNQTLFEYERNIGSISVELGF